MDCLSNQIKKTELYVDESSYSFVFSMIPSVDKLGLYELNIVFC